MNHVGTVTIDTERLILRKFEVLDAQNMFDNWANSREVCKFLSWEPHGSVETTKDILARWMEAYQNSERYHWAIVLKEIGEVIGSLSVITLSEKHQNCELGYCMGEQYWGKGIMTEAVKAVISFLFNEVGFHRLYAGHDTLNPASGKVMQKSGMVLEGTLRHNKVRKDGSFADGNIWAILSDDWKTPDPY